MIFPTTIMLPITALAALFESIPSLSIFAKPFALVGGLIAKYLIFVAHWIAKIPFALISADYEFIMLWLAMTMLLFAFAIFLSKRKMLVRTVLTLSLYFTDCRYIFLSTIQSFYSTSFGFRCE